MSLFSKLKNLKKHKNHLPTDLDSKFPIIHNSLNQPIDKLDQNGDLPFGWIVYHKELDEYNSELVDLALKTRENTDVDTRIKSYKRLIDRFYWLKNYCYNQNDCYKKYFDDHYMHCQNSVSSDFCYITPFEQDLENILNNYEQKVDEYNNYLDCQTFVENKSSEILNIIRKTLGLLQKDLKKNYDKKYYSSIDTIIFQLVKSNKIKKEKYGNSNKLYIKQ